MLLICEMVLSMLCFVERELLGDQVSRLVWQAYLQMAKLPFSNKIAPNADYMSPTGATLVQSNLCIVVTV